MIIRLTKHAERKIIERNIRIEDVHNVVLEPEFAAIDKYDGELKHFIGRIDNKYLRVIGRFSDKEEFLIVSAFYDRRLKKR